MFPVGPDPPAGPLGAHVARGTPGRHGAVSHHVVRNRAGARKVSELRTVCIGIYPIIMGRIGCHITSGRVHLDV